MSDKFRKTLLKKVEERGHEEKNTGTVLVAQLIPNPYQPRINIDKKELEELANSIVEQGLLQPILVTKDSENKNKYIIIAGHRRVEAHKLLAKKEILVHEVEDISEEDLISFSITENLQRENLSIIEEAIALKQALVHFESVKNLSSKLGIDRTTVGRKIGLLKLDEKIISDLKDKNTTTDVKALSLLNTIEKELQFDYYLSFLKKGREWLIGEIKKLKEIEQGKKNTPISVSSSLKKKKLVFTIKSFSHDIDPIIAEKIDKEIKKIVQALLPNSR